MPAVEILQLTVYNDQVTQDQNHGVATEDEVSAVHVVAVNAQSEARHDLDNSVEDLRTGDGMVKLSVAVILGVGRGENCDDHGDGPVAVEEADDDTDPPDEDTPGAG